MSTISCTEFERLLDELVESSGSVDAAPLAGHSATCTVCREIWQRHTLLERAVGDWRTHVPHTDLVDAIVARFAFEQPVPSAISATHLTTARPVKTSIEGSRRRQAWGSVVVAVLALFIATFMVFRTRAPVSEMTGNNARLAVVERTADSASTEESGEELEAFVANAGSAYLVLANDAAGAVASASRVIAPTNRLAMLGSDSPETGVQPAGEWSDEFQPIRRQFSEALDFLFDAVPVESSSI